MIVHDYVKLAAVGALIALTVFAVRREHKHPLLVTRVSEIVVTRVAAEEVEPHKVIVVAHRKVIEDDHAHHEHKPATPPHQTPWALPWSCSKVKWAASTFSAATLEWMRKANGVAPLTPAQKQQARECIEGKRS